MRVRVLKAVKQIRTGEEITVHYGSSYWDVVAENKRTTICKKYQGSTTASHAPSGARKPSSGSSNHEKNFYNFQHRYAFKYFDGIVCDLSGSGLPPLVLLQAGLGDLGTDIRAHNLEQACAMKGIAVVDCPPEHAAYPGKMLVASREFMIGDELCVYAGVMTRMPEAQMQLNESDYITSIVSSSVGAYGFELEDCEANFGMVFKRTQYVLPSVTPLINGRLIPNPGPASSLSRIEDIRGIGKDCTEKLLAALIDPSKRELVRRLLKRLNNYGEKNWKTNAISDIKRTLSSAAPIKVESPDEDMEGSTVVVESKKKKIDIEQDKENQVEDDWFKRFEDKVPKRRRISKAANTGLDGSYWATTDWSGTSSSSEGEVESPPVTNPTTRVFATEIDVGNTNTIE